MAAALQKRTGDSWAKVECRSCRSKNVAQGSVFSDGTFEITFGALFPGLGSLIQRKMLSHLILAKWRATKVAMRLENMA